VAGFLAIIYILRGVFTTTLSESTAKSLARMVYGIVCFATLFSFVGTVLGGIWADQSWGRFWGWDPKENGALLIVLWNATILHARWGGLVRERGLMNLAVIGNIVTSFSWFGVNMLGIGLHSYGFTDAAFKWLILFIVSQVAIILLGLMPQKLWRSFQAGAGSAG
jgi:ABC-type transport system involved in cytochrome c biogenesis permease subunit